MTKDLIKKIASSYDQDVEDFRNSVDPESRIPDSIKETEAYKSMQEVGGGNSGSPEVKEYLDPKAGMNFLDIGSCANLFTHNLGKWPSTYYGVDISPKLVASMKKVAEKRGMKLGDLVVADMADLPFEDNFFDIAANIGVLEYYDAEYIEKSLVEMKRVLKPGSRVVVDMVSLDHPDAAMMLTVEKLKGREYTEDMPTREEFEEILKKYFEINKRNDSGPMVMYFVVVK